MRTNPRRGQSLVLACLYMLALVVMVMMTLGIAQRVREKIELNTVADTAAYSNAVATARAYNAVALMNRAAIAHWINLAGVESLISWTGLFFAEYYSILQGIIPNSAFQYEEEAHVAWIQGLPGYNTTGPDALACQEAMADALWTPMNDLYNNDLKINWLTFIDDAAKAGEQGRRLQDAIGNLKGAEEGVVGSLRGMIGNRQIATDIAAMANESDVNAGVSAVDARNVVPWLSPPQTGLDSDKVWWAVMDARSPWVKNRSNDPILKLEQALQRNYGKLFQQPASLTDVLQRNNFGNDFAITGSVTFDFQTHGHGCFGADFGAACETAPDWTNALAQDWATTNIHINIGGIKGTAHYLNGSAKRIDCPAYKLDVTLNDESRVKASDIFHDDDLAWFDVMGYGGSGQTYVGPQQGYSPVMSQLVSKAITQHTMGPCTDDYILRPCHSVYVGIVSLDHGAALGGQAKNHAGLTRDHSHHGAPGTKDPWDAKFRFAFTRTGAGSNIDLGHASDEPAVSVGTGIAYYHRRGAFTETPNLFNPYWRATLIGARRGTDDYLGLPPQASQAWQALKSAGYRGEN